MPSSSQITAIASGAAKEATRSTGPPVDAASFSSASSSPPASSRTRGRIASIRSPENACSARARSRVWSGGSSEMIIPGGAWKSPLNRGAPGA